MAKKPFRPLFGCNTPEELQEFYSRRSKSSKYIATRRNSVNVINFLRAEDPEYRKEHQDKATKGKLASERFRTASRDSLKKISSNPEVQEKRKRRAAEGLRGVFGGRTKSVPTEYAGTWFKGLAEARFAEYCDSVDWTWLYEPFTLPTKLGDILWNYNPDFYILDYNLVFELKGWNFNGLRETLSEVEKQNGVEIHVLSCKEVLSLPGDTTLLKYPSRKYAVPAILDSMFQIGPFDWK